jgi:hypothetical protein
MIGFYLTIYFRELAIYCANAFRSLHGSVAHEVSRIVAREC